MHPYMRAAAGLVAGQDTLEAKKFYTDYLNSPKYIQRLKGQNYIDPVGTRDARLRNVLATSTSFNQKGDLQYTDRKVDIDPKEIISNHFNMQNVLTHEYGHAAGAEFDDHIPDIDKVRMNPWDTQAIHSRNHATDEHDRWPFEPKADMDTLRFLLKKDGIYDAGTQDFDLPTLDKAREQYGKDPGIHRLLNNFKDEDLIYLMNNVASSDHKPVTMAQYGGSLIPQFKKYDTGGDMGTAAGVVGSLADSIGTPDQYGKKSLSSNILGNAGKMAAMGSMFGPVGTLVGAGVGIVKGVIDNHHQKTLADMMMGREKLAYSTMASSQANARISSDPSIVTGNLAAGYYATGGPLNISNQPIQGGTATPMSSSSAEFQGPSHAQGGIQLPAAGAEVEGGETTSGDYVFSKELGFAQAHKPIAKAIGRIEVKALSPERINALKLLKQKEQNLKLSQEYTKHILGLN